SGSGENRGPAPVQVLLNELAQLEACVSADGTVDEFMATEVLRRYGRLDDMPMDVAERVCRADKMLQAIEVFAAACANPVSTVADVLEPILRTRLFEVDDRLLSAYMDDSPPPSAPSRREDESKKDRMRRGWCALFASPWSQLKKYRAYLSGNSALATHQVVKGSEFLHVMVVMDDNLAGGNQIAYDKIFGGTGLSQTDTNNVDKGKETAIDRTLRLLYVTCSRAQESLALVLWSSDPAAALKRIKESDWFADGEFEAIPEKIN
ncbi:MAG: hypothetical protein LC677_15235, partial [Halomonas sp.]|nr:hypothetical protein [Halomonas sp.]